VFINQWEKPRLNLLIHGLLKLKNMDRKLVEYLRRKSENELLKYTAKRNYLATLAELPQKDLGFYKQKATEGYIIS